MCSVHKNKKLLCVVLGCHLSQHEITVTIILLSFLHPRRIPAMISSQWTLLFAFLFFESSSCCDTKDFNPCCQMNDFEFHCPTNSGDIIVHTKEEVSIRCPQNFNFKIQQLPQLEVGRIDSLTIINCNWMKTSIRKILGKFSMTHVSFLEISQTFTENLESFDVFEGLEKLENLSLDQNRIKNLNGKIFLNTPNLRYLGLSDNNIKLKEDTFRNLFMLEFLDLSFNNIEDFPRKVFEPLKNLQSLHLVSNKLAKLDSVFEDLPNLQSLEISSNKIQSISENAFKKMKNLKFINLSSNKIKTLPPNLFKLNKKLKLVRLRDNFELKLPDYIFANTVLTEVDLINCNLGIIPEHIFANSTSLRIIKLKNNSLKYLPEALFEGLINLKMIRLENNQIETIYKIFNGLKRLKSVYLDNNLISMLSFEAFEDLVDLEKISLKNNKITNFDGLFSNKKTLKIVDLSFNKIVTPFDKTINLDGTPNLTDLNLSHNNISTVKLENVRPKTSLLVKLDYNPVTIVDFQNFNPKTNSEVLKISLKNSSIECDCQNYELFEFLINKKKETHSIDINLKNSKCANFWKQNSSLSLLTCALEKLSNYTGCPEKCACKWRPFDRAIIIDCSFRNLSKFPKIDTSQIGVKFNQTVVNLQGNDLTVVPDNLTGFDNITQLFLSDNKIRTIAGLPPKLEILELDHNHITNLDKNLIKQLNSTSLVRLALHDNPWLCNCSSLHLSIFLRQKTSLFDRSDLHCVNSDKLLIDLKETDLCHHWDTIYIILAILSLLLILATFFAVYYRHQQPIKAWFFAKNLCLCWVSEKELDKDKTYDVFISYSHKDEDFVIRNIVPQLENGPRPYKLCLHQRDWIPGELITDQIFTSVHQSRRTLVVLSENFLESVWGKMEFRTAHTSAMKEGRTRVVIALLGDIDIDSLDEELKMYLKTNTYVKWGDQFFWNKLKYALPHHKRVVSGGGRGHRFANIFLRRRESKLLGSEPLNPEYTPPVSSRSSLARVNPFCFGGRTEETSSFNV